MRIDAYMSVSDASGALSALDGFAELAGGFDGEPAIGGFRILRPRPSQRARIKARALRRMASAHLRASGSLSVLFLGGLALAVLAGPVSCPCDSLHAASPLLAGGDARAMSRLAYTRASEIRPTASRKIAPLTKLATLVDPYEATLAAASPITTASITPVSTRRQPLAGLAHLGALPSKIDTIAAAQPEPIRLAAATPATDVPVPLVPVIEVPTPEAPEAAPPAAETHVTHARTVSRRRHHAQRARMARSSDPAVIAAQKQARAPRWAKQMFDNPWQSSAFSYIR